MLKQYLSGACIGAAVYQFGLPLWKDFVVILLLISAINLTAWRWSEDE